MLTTDRPWNVTLAIHSACPVDQITDYLNGDLYIALPRGQTRVACWSLLSHDLLHPSQSLVIGVQRHRRFNLKGAKVFVERTRSCPRCQKCSVGEGVGSRIQVCSLKGRIRVSRRLHCFESRRTNFHSLLRIFRFVEIHAWRVPAFDPVESNDEFDDAFPQDGASVVPVGSVVEQHASATHSGRLATLATAVDDDDCISQSLVVVESNQQFGTALTEPQSNKKNVWCWIFPRKWSFCGRRRQVVRKGCGFPWECGKV